MGLAVRESFSKSELKFYLVGALKLLLKNYFVLIKQYVVSWYEKKLR